MKETLFLHKYIVSELRLSDVHTELQEKNQLTFERKLRTEVVEKRDKQPEYEINAKDWQYYYCHQSYCVDRSSFYSTLKKVEFDAITTLFSKTAQKIKINLWSYCAVTLWCNGKKVGAIEEAPVYKPIVKKELFLDLQAGDNTVYIALQTLGVRDTRTLFAIEIVESRTEVENRYPQLERDDLIDEKVYFLHAIELRHGELHFSCPAYDSTCICYDSGSNDYAQKDSKITVKPIGGLDKLVLDTSYDSFSIQVGVGTQSISRKFQNYTNTVPAYVQGLNNKENAQRIFTNIAQKQSLSRGGKFGFSIPNILARKHMGITLYDDNALLAETLDQIEKRYDCSDFLLSGLIRYMNNYEVTESQAKRIKEVLLGYRYWMHMDGADGMCYWSENHSMLFYSCALLVGKMYPNDYFYRAKMTGCELSLMGKKLLIQWFDDVLEHDFEEFNSTVYVCVTVAGLLNVYDYCSAELSEKAGRALDRIFKLLALHTFDGVLFSPMGRVYRQVIAPFTSGAQSLINLINPKTPITDGEGWIAYFATTSYQCKPELIQLMDSPISCTYTTANALIHLEKTENFCVTSVESPRLEPYQRWQNITLEQDDFVLSNNYTKSINERYHGTSDIRPGVYGYQQHLWSVALSNEAFIFANHPGESCDESSMRPGFWYGNGVMPAVRQEKNNLAVIYDIPENHPIQFIHLFFPKMKFDRVERSGNWIFASRQNGLIGIWCSEELVENNDILFDCELRSQSPRCAMYITVSAQEDFDAFRQRCVNQSVRFIPTTLEFITPSFTMKYEKHKDKTQRV